MINLEQVKLLEEKVAKTIDYVDRLTKENGELRRQEVELRQQEAELRRQETELQTKLESYQKRIDELEVLITGFKDDQDRIEEGILSALDRLSQFEKAMEKTLRKPSGKAAREQPAASEQITETETASAAMANGDNPGEGQTCFEIPEAAVAAVASEGDAPELDIF